MRKWMATLLFLVLVFGFACAWAETAIDKVDLTGDWKMDYFGIPMFFFFYENGTFEALIDMGSHVADDGSNGFTGDWTFDGKTLTISDDGSEPFTFTWDGEKLTGVMEGVEVSMIRAIEPEDASAE